MWDINKAELATLPLYRRIMQLVQEAIEKGMLGNGKRLPSERKLALIMGVNRSTVIRALDELVSRGVLLRKVGSGTYVNQSKWGVQSYTMLNWQSSPLFAQKNKNDDYPLLATALKNKAVHEQFPFWDLSKDSLAADLLPDMLVPELDWQELIKAEQEDETSHLGMQGLRHSIKLFLKKYRNMEVPSSQILVTSGTQQAIFLLTQCLLRPGDAIGVEQPSYFYSLPAFQAAGLRLYALPMDENGITLAGLQTLAQKVPLKMLFLNPIFHNPTGTCMSKQRKQEILAYCASRRIPIVEDDAYALLYFSEQTDTTPIKASDQSNQVLYIGSLSSYVGKNLRLGWIVAPESMVEQLAEVRHHMDAGLSVLPQVLARHYLQEGLPTHLHTLRSTLQSRAKALATWLQENYHNRINFNLPKGGLYLYARMDSSLPGTEKEFLEDLLKKRMIVAKGTDFGDMEKTFRMNFSFFV